MDTLQKLAFDSKTEICAAVLGTPQGATEVVYLGESGADAALERLKGSGLIFAGLIAFRCGKVCVEPEPNAGLEALRILARGAGEFCVRLVEELKAEGYSADVLERLYRLPDPRNDFDA